ncbi:MAG: M16 family metallopeptidase, partial [Halocynthiibacter sp.]
EKVRSFSRGDLAEFVSEHYGPGQMILAAAGAVDHDDLVRRAEALFGDLSARTAPVQAPARYRGGERRQLKELEQAHFALAFEGPAYRDPEIYAAQVYAGVMGGGMSSRLFQEIREKRGLCYSIFMQAGAFSDSGLMTVYAGTSAQDIDALAGLTMTELARVTQDLSTPEVSRARAQMKAGLLMGLESPSNRAERLARMVSIWGRVPGVDEVVERIDAVGVAEVQGFGERLLDGATPTLALYGPVEKAPELASLMRGLGG